MAAATAINLTCLVCGHTIAITNLTEVQHSSRTFEGYKCPSCRQNLPFRVASVRLTHSGQVGANTYVNHALAKGVITSSVG